MERTAKSREYGVWSMEYGVWSMEDRVCRIYDKRHVTEYD